LLNNLFFHLLTDENETLERYATNLLVLNFPFLRYAMPENKNPSQPASHMLHHIMPKKLSYIEHYLWESGEIDVFDELIISWNAQRPIKGSFKIEASIYIQHKGWSDWLPYALWGSAGQSGGEFKVEAGRIPISVSQDILEVVEGYKANQFRIKVTAQAGLRFDHFYALHACASRIHDLFPEPPENPLRSIDLDVPLCSQMLLNHPRHHHLCSSTSTSAAIAYLMGNFTLDPVSFALKAYDQAFDIFGNWVLNVAQASALLGKEWLCWVERLRGFECIFKRLCKNTPVVVSVRGPLPGSAKEYSQGHLIVVRGYDAQTKKVLCMDPAFDSDEKTNVAYDFEDFMQAWRRRGYISYIFQNVKSHPVPI
jgi:hypothetical protein